MENNKDSYSKGYNLLKALDTEAADKVITGLQDIAPECAPQGTYIIVIPLLPT